jgi:hypothetical protein
MPIPGIMKDGLQPGMLGFPAKHLTCVAGIRNQHRRVAGAARRFAEGHGAPRYFPRGIDDFAHGVSLAGTQV